MAPHHRPIHPEHFHRIPAISHGSLPHERSLLSAKGAVLRLTTAPHVFTRLMAPISTFLHRYVVGMLRYLDDWLILAKSRTTDLQARDRLLQVCEELGLSQLQKVVLDPFSGHDLSRHADPVSSVRCKTDRDEGRKSPQDHRGVSFIPGHPSSSLASSSGPPFVPYSSGKGWDVKGVISPDSPQFQLGLPR